MTDGRVPGCPLCQDPGGHVVAGDSRLRVVRVQDDPGYPAYYRVIWNRHVPEWTDLDEADRQHLMQVVAGVETVLREWLAPAKVNLASLGNQVPHLHWHVLARFATDPHFPGPIWGQAVRQADPAWVQALGARMPQVDARIAELFGAQPQGSAAEFWPVPPG